MLLMNSGDALQLPPFEIIPHRLPGNTNHAISMPAYTTVHAVPIGDSFQDRTFKGDPFDPNYILELSQKPSFKLTYTRYQWMPNIGFDKAGFIVVEGSIDTIVNRLDFDVHHIIPRQMWSTLTTDRIRRLTEELVGIPITRFITYEDHPLNLILLNKDFHQYINSFKELYAHGGKNFMLFALIYSVENFLSLSSTVEGNNLFKESRHLYIICTDAHRLSVVLKRSYPDHYNAVVEIMNGHSIEM